MLLKRGQPPLSSMLLGGGGGGGEGGSGGAGGGSGWGAAPPLPSQGADNPNANTAGGTGGLMFQNIRSSLIGSPVTQ